MASGENKDLSDSGTYKRYTDFADPSNPSRLETSDSPGTVLVTELLTTENYVTWSRSMQRAVQAKNKLRFMTGGISKPTDAVVVEASECCNDMVVSCLHNSVRLQLRLSVAFVDEASEIWAELKDHFTQQNGPRIYELKKSLSNLSQDEDPVSVYYGNLKSLWDEWMVYEPLPDCSCGQIKLLVDRYQRDCVIHFLMGPNDSFSNVRDHIMLIDPLPPVNKVFSYIQEQERQRQIASPTSGIDKIALAAHRSLGNFKTNNRSSFSIKKDRPFCTHYKINGHMVDNCFKIGYDEIPACTHCNKAGHTADR